MLLIHVSRASCMHKIFLAISYEQTHIILQLHLLPVTVISSQNSLSYVTIRGSWTMIWNPVTKSMKLWGILIPLWNTFSTYISPGYSNPWLPTRWDDPISKKKKKITCSWFSCTVFKNEFGVNIKVGEAVREKKILHNMVTGYSILSECTSMNILFLSLFLSSIILISFLTGNLFIIPRWYKILFFKKI